MGPGGEGRGVHEVRRDRVLLTVWSTCVKLKVRVSNLYSRLRSNFFVWYQDYNLDYLPIQISIRYLFLSSSMLRAAVAEVIVSMFTACRINLSWALGHCYQYWTDLEPEYRIKTSIFLLYICQIVCLQNCMHGYNHNFTSLIPILIQFYLFNILRATICLFSMMFLY